MTKDEIHEEVALRWWLVFAYCMAVFVACALTHLIARWLQ